MLKKLCWKELKISYSFCRIHSAQIYHKSLLILSNINLLPKIGNISVSQWDNVCNIVSSIGGINSCCVKRASTVGNLRKFVLFVRLIANIRFWSFFIYWHRTIEISDTVAINNRNRNDKAIKSLKYWSSISERLLNLCFSTNSIQFHSPFLLINSSKNICKTILYKFLNKSRVKYL